MKSNNVGRRSLLAGALATAVLGGQSAVAEDDMAKQSMIPPGNGDGQLIAAQVILRGYGGKTPIGTTFYEILGLKKREYKPLAPQISSGTPAELSLFNVHAGTGPGSEEQLQHFESAFLGAGRWLLARPDGAFDRWREQGRRADVLVVLHIKSTQWGLIDGAPNQVLVPPKFLLACSGAGLPVVLSFYS